MPSLLTDPKAAAIIELTGPWSDPSDPVTIDEDTVFFTRSFRPQKKQIKVEIFKWVQGDWYANTFDVGVGEAIGAQRRTNTKANPKGEQIDFGTGAVVVDVDARRAFRPKKKNRFQNPGETQALVYVDASGQLRERLVDIDKDDPGYKALKDKVYEPPKGQ